MENNIVNLDAYYYELVMQDKVTISMRVESKEKSKEATLKKLKENIKEVQKLFKENKLVAQVSSQSVYEEIEHSSSKVKKTGYWVGSGSVQVIAYDFDAINKVVDELIESNKAQLGQVITSISEKTKQTKEEEFTTKAIEVFQAKAKNVAKAFGHQDYSLINVTVNSASDEGNNMGRQVFAAASMSAMSSVEMAGGSEESSYISPRESKIYVTIKGSVQVK